MSDGKALVVLDQEDIDVAILAIEEAGVGLDEHEFREKYGDVYQKLHAIDQAGGKSYRVK